MVSPNFLIPGTNVADVRDTIDGHLVNIAWLVTNGLNTTGYVALTTAVVELFTRL